MMMAICGAFAGLAACVDVLGWKFQVSSADIQVSQVGFLASRWRCSAVTRRAARLRGAAVRGALDRDLGSGNISLTSEPDSRPVT